MKCAGGSVLIAANSRSTSAAVKRQPQLDRRDRRPLGPRILSISREPLNSEQG